MGPEVGSKRGSRAWGLLMGITSRRRETAFFEDCSVGACLEERVEGRGAEWPALRSRASAFVHVSSSLLPAFLDEGFLLLLVLGVLRVAWALARAPKDMEFASSGSSSSSSEE